ncbi:MAG: nucleotidyl transferase AbiEii/AbiGii toxin family protein [Myxococcales bacterium]|nr:nucleotidyl transferase AbiEii/AbiGii toxin family protein [Myxococcales bacterium]
MTKKPVTNLAASIRSRLLALSRRRNEPFQSVLTRYVNERLLYRLSRHPVTAQYALKGAMLLATWPDYVYRPTLDIDLLGHGDSSVTAVRDLFAFVIAIDAAEDAVSFDHSTLRVEPVREDERYAGLTVRVDARLDTAKVPVQIDIGFGDHVHPRLHEADYRLLLPELPAVRLRMYPKETVVAEKFQVMLDLATANSRVKDYYDIWVATQHLEFDLIETTIAVRGTLARRRTPIPAGVPAALTDAYVAIVAQRGWWSSFLRVRPPRHAPPPFPEIVVTLRAFFGQLLASLDADPIPSATWMPGGPRWIAERE